MCLIAVKIQFVISQKLTMKEQQNEDYDNTEDEESVEDNTDYFSDIVNEEDLVVVY